VTVVVLWLLCVIASTSGATERTGVAFRVAVTVLLAGTAVAGVFALIGLASDEVEVGSGIVVFAGGGLTCLVLLHHELRGWWDPALAR
jgi:FlaG/FlaF family flagellin (archaellin)